MNNLFIAALLSLTPVSELRGGIPYGIGFGYSPWLVFLLCTFANILTIFIAYFFLDFLHNHFVKIPIYKRIFDRTIERARKKIETRIGTSWESVALYLFVAVPLPGTGAYTGTLIAWFFGLNRMKSIIAIALGVVTAGILITLMSIGVFSVIS